MFESQQWLGRVRRPRVQITYDVEIGDAIEMKELPCVVGVIADLSGDRDPDSLMPPIRDRKFKEIDRDNFDEIMNGCHVRLGFQVNNVLAGNATGSSDSLLNILLNFRTMDDFSPVNVLNQVPELSQLYQIRSKLKDLLIKLDGNDRLDDLLTNLLADQGQQKQLASELQGLQNKETTPKVASTVTAPKSPKSSKKTSQPNKKKPTKK